MQAHVLLQRDGVADAAILDGAEGRFVDQPLVEVAERGLELARPQQAADVVGAERRLSD